jgi:DNA adenine methylase
VLACCAYGAGVVSFFGSKGQEGTWKTIVAAMPPHDTYIETHLGSGVVLYNKPLADMQYGIELDLATFMTHKVRSQMAVEKTLDGYPDQAEDIFPSRTSLVPGRCEKFLTNFDYRNAGRVLVYSDPPYVRSTRTSAKRYHFDYSDDDHCKLIHILKSIPAAVILSGYPSSLYDELLPDWRTLEFQAMTRGGPRTEKLWFNFPEGKTQWATWAGKNFRKRQDLKRKAARWAAKFRKLPAADRLAIRAALDDVDSATGTTAEAAASAHVPSGDRS